MNLKNWMSEIDNNTEIFKLNLVGTHDCVTQFVQFSHISKCQNKNIYQQLLIGIRCLDIRVMSKDDRLGMVHGIAKAFNTPNHLSKQMDMADVLAHCYKFLDENPSETIIFQFKNDSGKENEKCFDNLYNTYISKNSKRWFLQDRSPVMSEARGKIILIRRCKKYTDKEYPLGTGIDFSQWIEQDIAVPEPLLLHTGNKSNMLFIVQDRFKYKPEQRWHECIKPFLYTMGEFDGRYIINYLSTAGGFKGPYNNALYINPKFMEYQLDNRFYYGMIYTDFPTPELAEKIISTNFKR
ncbi:MAG: phosphatidylinositol-specific phospholipase C domain-containing protein [Acetobacter sp.]|nr:phosphatidylinositol-specific phospholipase C domain-containing protein [Bacteroides sp.]MCM1341808.1 phosphatidylinositol-specific phospholipase C domain-containing protein [Acetobacter sp.]MCM1433974.1 phosphatidylinositol-specific phospholipase C domain-containing protein [Clostridiales bacterium]